MYKIWIDEAGRWPWLGPVVACALTFNPNNLPDKNFLEKLTDSKKLSAKKREEIFKELVEKSRWENPKIFFGVGVVDNFMIDEINIKQANKEAMRRALVELLRKITPDWKSPLAPLFKGEDKQGDFINWVFIDGRDNYVFDELEKKPIYIVWWDAKVKEIGAASIIAKVFRDKMIDTYALLYPDLGLENHKWYGTKKHKEKLQKKSDITWIHRLSYKPIKNILEKKEKLLLHVCCGPDASVPIMDLKDKYDLVCFWYDPNIQPKAEYDKRFKEFVKVCEIEGVSYIEWEYDVENFLREIKGLEHTPEKWEKCTKCYDLRLKRASEEARKLGIKYWTTTLNISPHKDLEKLFKIWDKYSLETSPLAPLLQVEGNKNELQEKLEFLKIAFRKNKGFERSVDYCKKHNIYRQNYCGCIYSDTFPEKYKK